MKTKTIFMLAAMLLMSMGAFAQSNEPLEGDVNKDGKVDVADIVKVIDIMAAGEQPQPTVYYWYAGQNQPISQSSITPQDSGAFTNNNWHTIDVNNTYTFSNPIYNSESNPIPGDSKTNWYVALPANKSYGIYDSVDRNEVTNGNWTIDQQITVTEITYNIYKSVGTYRNLNVWWIH